MDRTAFWTFKVLAKYILKYPLDFCSKKWLLGDADAKVHLRNAAHMEGREEQGFLQASPNFKVISIKSIQTCFTKLFNGKSNRCMFSSRNGLLQIRLIILTNERFGFHSPVNSFYNFKKLSYEQAPFWRCFAFERNLRRIMRSYPTKQPTNNKQEIIWTSFFNWKYQLKKAISDF